MNKIIERFREHISRAKLEALNSPEELQGYVEQFIIEELEKQKEEIVNFIESESGKSGRQEIIKFIKNL